jgi:hypothetical protein
MTDNAGRWNGPRRVDALPISHRRRRPGINCITCGRELHPERAQKYTYCTRPECREKNAQGITIVSVGVNKSADQYQVLDERAREDLAAGKHHDQRRGTYGDVPAESRSTVTGDPPVDRGRHSDPPAGRPRARPPRRRTWTAPQEKLALLYHSQGLRPDEIADKMGLSRYLVTQILLDAVNRRRP